MCCCYEDIATKANKLHIVALDHRHFKLLFRSFFYRLLLSLLHISMSFAITRHIHKHIPSNCNKSINDVPINFSKYSHTL